MLKRFWVLWRGLRLIMQLEDNDKRVDLIMAAIKNIHSDAHDLHTIREVVEVVLQQAFLAGYRFGIKGKYEQD